MVLRLTVRELFKLASLQTRNSSSSSQFLPAGRFTQNLKSPKGPEKTYFLKPIDNFRAAEGVRGRKAPLGPRPYTGLKN